MSFDACEFDVEFRSFDELELPRPTLSVTVQGVTGAHYSNELFAVAKIQNNKKYVY